MKNEYKFITGCVICFILGIMVCSGIVLAETLLNALDVKYDNTFSGASSVNVQSAIDELYNLAEIHCPEGYICEKMPSFADDSWETIASNVLKDPSVYKVGDTKEVEVNGYGTFTVRVANNSTPQECSVAGFSQTACGFVIEFEDIITTHAMNSTSTNIGGWRDSEMRTWLNTTIYNALPKELRNVISETYTVSSHGSSDTSNFTTLDKLYLLSTKEVYGKNGTNFNITGDTAEAETRQLDYYNSIGVTTSNYSGAIKKNSSNSAYSWWLRSAKSTSTDYFYALNLNGFGAIYKAYSYSGVAPAFRLS